MAKFDQDAFNKAVEKHDQEQKNSGNENQTFETGGAEEHSK